VRDQVYYTLPKCLYFIQNKVYCVLCLHQK
jgi:hypothetical protein